MPLPDLDQLYRCTSVARRPEDLFGDLEGTLSAQLAALARTFRKMAQIAHPDHCPTDPHLAGQTFNLLQHWRQRAEEALHAGTYGGAVPVPITLRTGTYQVLETLRQSDYYTLYHCTAAAAATAGILRLKVARDPAGGAGGGVAGLGNWAGGDGDRRRCGVRGGGVGVRDAAQRLEE
jgi:hypothetical protein